MKEPVSPQCSETLRARLSILMWSTRLDEATVAGMSLGGTISLPGGSKMPKGQRDAFIAAVSAILAALISAAVTLYTSNKQIEEEREHSTKLQQQLDTYQAKYENAPQSVCSTARHTHQRCAEIQKRYRNRH